MNEGTTNRGFQVITAEKYSPKETDTSRIVQESSSVDPSLWVGQDHHLSRDEVKQLMNYLSNWLKTGRLFNE